MRISNMTEHDLLFDSRINCRNYPYITGDISQISPYKKICRDTP